MEVALKEDITFNFSTGSSNNLQRMSKRKICKIIN